MGNGRLDAVSNTIKEYFDVSYELSEYQEHALSSGSSSKAMAYVAITCDGKRYWGAGINEDIIKASIHALTVATNKLPKIGNDTNEKDERLFEILNYMQANYKKATFKGQHRKY